MQADREAESEMGSSEVRWHEMVVGDASARPGNRGFEKGTCFL
jgi:hypothetical protein